MVSILAAMTVWRQWSRDLKIESTISTCKPVNPQRLTRSEVALTFLSPSNFLLAHSILAPHMQAKGTTTSVTCGFGPPDAILLSRSARRKEMKRRPALIGKTFEWGCVNDAMSMAKVAQRVLGKWQKLRILKIFQKALRILVSVTCSRVAIAESGVTMLRPGIVHFALLHSSRTLGVKPLTAHRTWHPLAEVPRYWGCEALGC
ncbi:hypothetical protein F5148DRAFT_874467 [Russula earlei]|uniref:Uncharacterized protein n=1 Tax=Russula earlei TaxID=71964 RepID=A0ACC0UAD3_9AGAM|nr:hypothetical protein F5148DRAFT_874467 [Russula earlei]